jgi:adenylate cyclase class 2
MRKEIEVKAKVHNFETLIRALENLGCVIGEGVTQEDFIFSHKNDNFLEKDVKKTILRIRKSKGKALFTIKESQGNELDCIEHETEVVDPGEMHQAILLMGYQEVVRLKKVRRKANYNDLEICLDEVEELGFFIEVEKIAEDVDGEKVQSELFEFLISLGVDPADRVLIGYDTLMYKKVRGL